MDDVSIVDRCKYDIGCCIDFGINTLQNGTCWLFTIYIFWTDHPGLWCWWIMQYFSAEILCSVRTGCIWWKAKCIGTLLIWYTTIVSSRISIFRPKDKYKIWMAHRCICSYWNISFAVTSEYVELQCDTHRRRGAVVMWPQVLELVIYSFFSLASLF